MTLAYWLIVPPIALFLAWFIPLVADVNARRKNRG